MKSLASRINWWGLLAVALAIGAWALVSWIYNSVLLPGPVETVQIAWANIGAIFAELLQTIRRGVIAFAIAVAIFVPFGIFCGRVRKFGQFVDPVLEFMVTIPAIAIIPIVMLLAGVGDGAKISVIVFAMVNNVLVNTIETVRQQPPMLNRVGRSLRLSKLETMIHIDLPAALPGIVTGLRLAVNTSLLVGITSEMLLSTNGLGSFLMRSQESFKIGAGLAGILVIAITVLLVNIGLRKIEERFFFWHYRTGVNR